MTKSAPLVSVLVPVFNRASFVVEALESIAAQTYGNLEILVQDDGSTDATPQLLADFAGREPRVKVERWEDNRGLVAARNRLIERAQGSFGCYLDSDDSMLPDKISAQLRFLDEHPQTAAVGTGCIYVEADGRTEIALVQYSQDYERLRYVPQYCCASLMYRMTALRSAFPIRAAFKTGEDVDLILRVSEQAHVTNIPDYLYKRRRHAGQISHGHESGHVLAMASSLYRLAGRPDFVGDEPLDQPSLLERIAHEIGALYLNGSTARNRYQQLAAVLVVLHAGRRAKRLRSFAGAMIRCLRHAPGSFFNVVMLWARPERGVLR
jgi:glycosyltransferase involved in cell wall biosynthesis